MTLLDTKINDFLVVYEDNHLIAVNKRSGLLVQGDSTGDITLADLVKKYIKAKYNKPGDVFLGVIHRIDRPVSGLVIFARTSKALARMNELFRLHQVQKTYLAVCEGIPSPPTAELIHWMRKDTEKNKSYLAREGIAGAKLAMLSYQMLSNDGERSLIEVRPQTGRPHQIRLQLSSIGCPIIGDLKYGGVQAADPATIYLHSYRAVFTHPVSKEHLELAAPVPEGGYWSLF